MKKIILVLSVGILLFIEVVSSETIYSEWSTIQTGYLGEEEATQYGVILPKIWSEWSALQATDPTDIFFQKSKDFGQKNYFLGGGEYMWDNAEAKSLCKWDFGERSHITYFYIDVDCYRAPSYDCYIQPPMQLYVDGELVASVGSQTNIRQNWCENLDVWGTTAELKMLSGLGSGRNRSHIVGTYLQTSLIKYSHVIEWNDPINWRFDDPYELIGGEKAQKPAERQVYRYPISPKITVEQRYLYIDSTIEDIENLATAIDYDGKDITDKIVITEIKYDDTEYIARNPSEFDPNASNTIHVTYYVMNDKGAEDIKTVKLYILRDGIQIDFNIYARYIDKENIYTLDNNSIWKTKEYKDKLNEAIKWIERK